MPLQIQPLVSSPDWEVRQALLRWHRPSRTSANMHRPIGSLAGSSLSMLHRAAALYPDVEEPATFPLPVPMQELMQWFAPPDAAARVRQACLPRVWWLWLLFAPALALQTSLCGQVANLAGLNCQRRLCCLNRTLATVERLRLSLLRLRAVRPQAQQVQSPVTSPPAKRPRIELPAACHTGVDSGTAQVRRLQLCYGHAY